MAYVESRAEGDRLAMAGGVAEPTRVMKEYTAGAYLDVLLTDLRTLKENGWHTNTKSVTSVTANRGWSPTELGLTACEDASRVKLLNSRGNEVQETRPRRFVQRLTATKVDGRWKISDVDSKIVKNLDVESGCSF